MIPIKIQNIQIAALSADKGFQSIKHLPQNQVRIFEGEVQKHLEDTHERTEAAEKSEKSRIRDEKEGREESRENEEETRQQTTDQEAKPEQNRIEKKANGTIKHLDVKI
jgi:hypothetical protein